MPDPCNAKEYCQSKIITHQPKSFENPKIFDIKSVIIEHPNTSHNFSKVGSNSSLYTDTKGSENLLN